MKLLDKRKWIIIFAVCVLLMIVARPADMMLAKWLYNSESVFGSFFFTVVPTIPFVLCSFSCAVMMSCRSTRTTRSKNRMLNFIYAVLTVLFAVAAAWYPFIKIENKNFTVIAVAALLISGGAFFIAFSSFPETYQKITMTGIAKTTLASSLAAAVICAAAYLLPQRPTYEALLICAEKYGTTSGPYESTVPFISFVGAAAAVPTVFNRLTDVLPKLKFSGTLMFVLSLIWAAAVMLCVVISGKMYLSEASYGLTVSYICLLVSSVIEERREKT